MSTHEEVVRFTFDCPVNLHIFAKMKATANHQSMKDYLIGLLAKDAVDHPVNFLNNKSFENELKKILQDDSDLMKKVEKVNKIAEDGSQPDDWEKVIKLSQES